MIWLCPENVTEPSSEDQANLCDVLFQAGLVETCKPPNGEEMLPPTLPPLTDSRYIHFVPVYICMYRELKIKLNISIHIANIIHCVIAETHMSACQRRAYFLASGALMMN